MESPELGRRASFTSIDSSSRSPSPFSPLHLVKHWLSDASRLFSNPHFTFPLAGRFLRESRVTINTVFLFTNALSYLVAGSGGEGWLAEEEGLQLTVFFLLCLTLHSVGNKLLWRVVRESGPMVVNEWVVLVSVAAGLLILIMGRTLPILTAGYLLAEK